jgi:hypothetical protein
VNSFDCEEMGSFSPMGKWVSAGDAFECGDRPSIAIQPKAFIADTSHPNGSWASVLEKIPDLPARKNTISLNPKS